MLTHILDPPKLRVPPGIICEKGTASSNDLPAEGQQTNSDGDPDYVKFMTPISRNRVNHGMPQKNAIIHFS